MRNRHINSVTVSILIMMLLGAVTSFILFIVLLIPLALLITIFGG